ncbi:DUF1064 domain-containing protein [Vibrio owensii]|uniref:DUF1064 domain-containing protein n=1 Tax=Vibrio owensii TaxID=696485 RepID=UPI003CC541C5
MAGTQRMTAAEFRSNPKLLKSARMATSGKQKKTTDSAEKPKKTRGKYNAQKTEIDGIVFDSKLEGNRYSTLKVLEMAGEISDLRLQVEYPLSINEVLICKYYADFVYFQNGEEVVEDAKGMRTKEYILKRKMMKAIYGIDIFESNIKHAK